MLAKVQSGEYPIPKDKLEFSRKRAKGFLTDAREGYDGETDWSCQIAELPDPDDPQTHKITFELCFSATLTTDRTRREGASIILQELIMANEEHTDIIYNPLDYSETCTLYFYNGRAEKGEIYHYDRTCGHVQFIEDADGRRFHSVEELQSAGIIKVKIKSVIMHDVGGV